MQYVYSTFPSPVGELKIVASNEGLRAILWEDDDPKRVPLGELERDDHHPVLVETARQLHQYFAGTRTHFDLPLDLKGTDFQKMAWKAMFDIPIGETRTYGQLAKQLGNPKAFRAVGSAAGRNPISIICACHRLLGSTGKLTGFAGGLAAKAFLLEIETCHQNKQSQNVARSKQRRLTFEV